MSEKTRDSTTGQTFHYCEALIENGSGAPIGVSVGGVMTAREEWKNDPRRPRDEEWNYFE